MELVTAARAIHAIPDGSRVVLPHGAVEPSALYEAFCAEHERFKSLALFSGLQFGTYPYLGAGLGTHYSYTTWQASFHLRTLARAGKIGFLPLRFSQVCSTFSRDGPLPPDVVVIQTSPVERGTVSLGISVSIFPELVASARLVIAEMNPTMPRTGGAARLPVEAIDLGVEAERPLGTYGSRPRTQRDNHIVDLVLERVPERAWVQLGIGALPDAVLPRLAEVQGINLHSGMLTDGLPVYVEGARHTPRVLTGEVAGHSSLYSFLNGTTPVELHPTGTIHAVLVAGRLPRFVAINSAIEIDLTGQVNSEAIAGTQVSGVGGSLDFIEAAMHSPGGSSILALPSTTEDGCHSRIVATIDERTPVTIPRLLTDTVVSEFGAVSLRGLDLVGRARALIDIAHPDFRAALDRDAQWLRPGTGPDLARTIS